MIRILFEDSDLVICEKLPGMISEDSKNTDSVVFLLREQLKCELYVIHRLDKPVGGAIIYAKNKKTAATLSEMLKNNGIKKEYLAVTEGIPKEKDGEMRDLLFKDPRGNKTFVVKRMRKGVKEAILFYSVISENSGKALVKVNLVTGRSHQIRAQFASRKIPLSGDGKYGSHDNKCETALYSHSVSFVHPFTGQNIQVISEPDFNSYPWNLFKTENGK